MHMSKIPVLMLLAGAMLATSAHAQPPYTGPDFSGSYACIGNDSKEGPYTGTVTLKLVRAQSSGEYGAYDFNLQVPGYGAYPGEAASHGMRMAIHFANTDPKTKDFGTGIATFARKGGKWSFHKYYYEPQFKGGNFGTEDCTHQ
jgi:hypothetical protein